MAVTILTEVNNYGIIGKWEVEELPCGSIKKIRKLGEPYNNKNGEVRVYKQVSKPTTEGTARKVATRTEVDIKKQEFAEQLDRWLLANEDKCDD